MRVRLVVEGEKDRATLDEIARRLGADVVAPAVVANGRGEKIVDFGGFVATAYYPLWPRPDRIVVVDDCDTDPPQEHLDALDVLKSRCKVPVEVVVISRELEAWFLADWESVVGGTGMPSGWPLHPETVADAKELLRDRLHGAWNQVTAGELAQRIDLDRVTRRCDHWNGLQRFAAALGCPMR